MNTLRLGPSSLLTSVKGYRVCGGPGGPYRMYVVDY